MTNSLTLAKIENIMLLSVFFRVNDLMISSIVLRMAIMTEV